MQITVMRYTMDGLHPGEDMVWARRGHLTEAQVHESAVEFINTDLKEGDDYYTHPSQIAVSNRKDTDADFTVFYAHIEVPE